jgi:alpha-beta hydrolase superfamily lysophospholipase
LLAYAAIKDSDFADGLVLCSSAIEVNHNQPLIYYLVGWLSSVFFPKLEVPKYVFSLDPKDLSRLEKEVTDYEKDPFVYHGGLRNRTGWELLLGMSFIQRRMGRILTPFLAMHGDQDRIADAEGSRKLHARTACEDKQLHIFEGAYHELFFDETADEALALATQWLLAHIK